MSFNFPNESPKREAATTGYRVAIVSGKGLAFPKPATRTRASGPTAARTTSSASWKTGTGFRRRCDTAGSLVSFFISRQGIGTFKCCQGDAYIRGPREMAFDSDFLTPSLLPPGTPMFRDVNTLTFRQLLRPTPVTRRKEIGG